MQIIHSKWAPKERGLNEEELAAIDSNGLYNLNDFLSKKSWRRRIKQSLKCSQASVDGELYDVERWGNFTSPMA